MVEVNNKDKDFNLITFKLQNLTLKISLTTKNKTIFLQEKNGEIVVELQN